MSLRNVAGLYLVRLRGRVGQELLALVGIAVGVSLLFAALVANSSLTGSFERLTDGVVGRATLQLSARGSDTLDGRVLDEVQALPSVDTAAGLLEDRAEVVGRNGRRASVQLVGVTPELARLGGNFTHGFSYGFLADVRAVAVPLPLVEDLGLALGEPVAMEIGARVVLARLGAKLLRSDVGALVASPVAVAPLRYAQELTGQPGRVTRLFVVPVAGEEEAARRGLERIAGNHANVRPADFEAELFRQASVPTSQSTAMFSVFGALVGFLFAFSAMLLTVPQRRHLIADLDAEGYRPRTIVKVLLFDAVVLGVVASALGIVLGDQVARRLFDAAPSFLQYAFAVGPQRIVTVENVVLAAIGGLVASCVAVLAPTLSALKELRDADRPTVRRSRRLGDVATVTGVVCLAVGVATVVAAPASAALGIGGLVALTASMLLLLPALLSLLTGLLDLATQDVRSVVPFLVSFELRDRTTLARSLAVAATGAVAVFASVALQGAHADLLRGLDQTSRDVAGIGEVWAVAPGRANLLVTTPFHSAQPSEEAGLASIRQYRGSFLDVGERRARVFGPDPDGPLPLSDVQLLDGDVKTAEQRLRAGGWVVVSEGIARDEGLHVGDRFTLPTPQPITLRVAALSTNMGWPPGALMLNGEDFERAWRTSRPTAFVATLAPGTSPAAGRRALRAALGESSLAVSTAAERVEAQNDAAREGVARLAQIAGLVLISAVLAMASAMAGLIWQRRGFLAGVKVEGYRTGELWKALLLETAILIGAGCLLGASFGLLGQSLLSRALTSVTGFPVVYSMAAWGAVLTCLAVTAAAVAIVAVFGQRAASVPAESGLSS
jgi:putative ABC transport system permease protein